MLLALGPFFIALLFFETTKRFFESWIAQLANYAFITILTVMVSALMLGSCPPPRSRRPRWAAESRSRDAVRVCLAAGLTLLIMRQVMPMAAGLGERVGALLLWPRERCARLGLWGAPRATPASSDEASLIGRPPAGIRCRAKPATTCRGAPARACGSSRALRDRTRSRQGMIMETPLSCSVVDAPDGLRPSPRPGRLRSALGGHQSTASGRQSPRSDESP